jgi:16S rRNA (guanine966-N2)-methyltransferase
MRGEEVRMRVVAGTAKGLHLDAPKGRDVRPTADRVREALFSSLGERVRGAAVLDLFGGTGALAIEALSRGAASAVIAEQNPRTADVIAQNLERTRLAERARIVRGDALKALPRLASQGQRFDLVFIDPPYASDLAERALSGLAEHGLLADGATVVVERERRKVLPEVPGLAVSAEKAYGDTALTFFERA